MAHAQNASINAQVSSMQVSVGQPFRYQVTVQSQGASVPNPRVGPLPDFDQAGTSTSQNISFVNGSVSASVSFMYTLIPRKEGKFTIPPASITIGDTIVKSNAIEITVTHGEAPAAVNQQGKPVAPSGATPTGGSGNVKVGIEVSPSKSRVYLGEPVSLSINVYGNTALAGFSLEPSSPQGFWMEDAKLPEKPEVEKRTTNGEQFYTVLVKRQIIFPANTGKLRIPASKGTVQYYVRRAERSPFAEFFNDPNFSDPFFQNPIFNRNVVALDQQNVASGSPEITVLPLPEAGRPSDFNGAVGRFTIKASLSTGEAHIGEGVTLAVEIEGQGNMKGISFPTIKEIPGLNLFTSNSSASFSADRASYHGAKHFEYILVPLSQGDYRIPAIEFSYFDAEAAAYRTIRTDSLALKVLPGAASTVGQAIANQFLKGGQKDIVDIHDIKPTAISALDGEISFSTFLLINLLPLAVFLMAMLYARHRHLIEHDASYGGIHLSRGAARKYLRSAAELLRAGNQTGFYLEITQALSRYIGHRFKVPPQSVQPDAIDELLGDRVPPALRTKCRELLVTCHLARYSQSQIERERQAADLRDCDALIKEMERL